MRLERVTAAFLAAGVLFVGGVSAAGPEGQAPAADEAAKPKAKMITAPLDNRWKSFGLRPEHSILAGFAGKATTSIHVNEGPFPRLKDTQGTAEGKLLMGGLFAQVTHSEERMKQPFERIIIYGYDQVIGKYTADVLDTTSTAIVRYVGTYDAGKRQLNLTARYSDQTSRRYVTSRLVTTFVDAKTWTYEEFLAPGPDQPEAPVALVTMKRS